MGPYFIPEKTLARLILAGKALTTLLLLVGMALLVKNGFQRHYFKYKILTIERTMPDSFQDLFVWEKQGRTSNKDETVVFVRFYQQIIKYFPEQADAWGMLGLCYYWRGDEDAALQAFQQARGIDPNYFWFNYNLGVLLYKRGSLEEAVPYFEAAIKTRPDDNLRFLQTSKVVYRSLLNEISDVGNELRGRILRGYQRAYEMLILISYQSQDFPAMLNYAESALISKVGMVDRFSYFAGLAKKKEADQRAQNFQGSGLKDGAGILQDPFLAEISRQGVHLFLF